MKRALRILSAAGVLCLVLFAACKKESVNGPDDPVVNAAGTWNGAYDDSVSDGIFSFTLTQTDSIITGTYTATSSKGVSGSGTVTGVISGKSFICQTSATSGICTVVNNVSGIFTGFHQGSSFSATYAGSNSCGGSWGNGTLSLTKQ